jgi:hypothetical protein
MALAGSFSVVPSYLNRSLQYLKASVACTVNSNGHVKWLVSKAHNDRLNITTKGLERYGSAGSFSVHQLPELAVLESVGGLHITRTAMVEEWCSFA